MGIFHKILLTTLLLWVSYTSLAQQTNQDFELGLASYHRSDWNGAITNFTKSIDAAFDLYDSYSYRGYSRAMQGDSNGAIADCSQVIKLNPNFSGGYYWRSRVELELTNIDVALHDFEIGIKFDSKNRPADLADELSSICHQRAFEKYKAGDLDNAITNLNEAIYITPTNSNRYALRGWLKLMQNHLDGAISDAFFAIKYNPKNIFAYDVQAWARYEREDISGAVEDCKEAVEYWSQMRAKYPDLPTTSNAFTTGGLLCFINGDFGNAIKEWSQFEDSNTNLPASTQEFIHSWIEKAQAKLAEKKL